MGRTLRGFEEAFPYLGDRGDVSDDGIIDKEEAYGAHFGAIGDHVADQMFGAVKRVPVSELRHHPSGHGSSGFARPRAPAPPSQDPRQAAQAASRYFASRGLVASHPNHLLWEPTGTSYEVKTPSALTNVVATERTLSQISRDNNVNLFKMRPKKGGTETSYVFTLSPRALPMSARLVGMMTQPLARVV